MVSAAPKRPLIAIVGSTGTGKSDLAVSLAERFNGEIINGDALQMYEGLPIATNKIPPEDRKGIPHHLLSCVRLDKEPWTVRQFRDRASGVIEEIRSRGRLPILVGGTHYYTQSLLFNDAVVEPEDSESRTEEENERKWPILDSTTEVILEELRKVDHAMATRWHPNDRRKIRRSLEIWLTTGKKASDVYNQQRQESSIVNLDNAVQPFVEESRSPLAYDSFVLWTWASSDVLNQRLAERVDKMVFEGLLDEVESMYDFMQEQAQLGKIVDQSRGIWVAIGFKELLPYITSNKRSAKLRQEGIDCTKIANRQYAKRQVRWIKLKLQRAISAAGACDKLFLLDATDLTQWHSVEERAQDITAAFLDGGMLPKPESLSDAAGEMLVMTEEDPKSARRCEICGKTLMSEQEWISHLKSKGHKSAVTPKIDWQALYPKNNHE